MSVRRHRLRTRAFQVVQCALAAGIAWFIAADVLGHPTPFFAPIAAVVSLGTSYGQRLRRVAEVTLGVAVGVLVGDILVMQIGTGWWQLTLVVGLAMAVGLLLDGGVLFVNQAAVQSIVVTTLVPDPGAGLIRWTDALVGGAVALVAATLVPSAPLRRPREQAAVVAGKIVELLREAASVMETGDVEHSLEVLAEARSTDSLVRELQDAADEGLSVVASSPFRRRHRSGLRKLADLVDPLDRALRSTRVLVRNTAVSAYHRRAIPESYNRLALELADAAELIAEELSDNRYAVAAQEPLLVVAHSSAAVERSDQLSVEGVLAQLRAVTADLLMVTGMSQMESTEAIPPPR